MKLARLAALAPLFAAAGACGPHPPPPPAPYHALGIDSAWHLIIDDKNVTYIGVGAQPVLQPRPQAIIGIAGEIYQTPRINVNIVHGPCVANSRTYPDSVQVTVDGTQHRGCGGL
ncbi:hypothetical protein G7078_05175 [Sphingomonas sinipercae]|uniref:Uncharacterized protein n=1 Tax=Sphingomonas sinipercae TaxID=2714944 RepID=A0A6G7ZMU3_9SPHN|nr:hypothetical protein [Sphingomonas sinipercae]QIL02238.1 hypothetical protein G7078_05175 [Sphingomonas sinipercae]